MISLRMTLAGLALALAFPLAAQAPPAKATPAPAVDAARVAAAAPAPVIDKLWPVGTYRRMLDGTLSKMMDQIMSSMPGIIVRVEAATAHLPSIPKKKTSDDDK
jgi:hypothetical protein